MTFVNPDPNLLMAARAYATAYNSYDYSDLEHLLDNDLTYTSMWVFEEMKGKENYIAYLADKLKAIKESGNPVHAEIAETRQYPMYGIPEKPCVYMKQGENEMVVLFTMEDANIKKIFLTGIPIPSTVFRSGECPGKDNNNIRFTFE